MSDEKCFVAFRPCGCLAAVAMERSGMAPEVEAYARQPGYRVEHLTQSEYHAAPKRCSEHPRPAAEEVARAGASQLPGFDEVPERTADGRRPSWTA